MSLTAVSLFAGVGGFDLAMERNGIQVVADVEIDKAARSVLERRFPNSTHFNDIKEVTGEQLRDAGFVPERGIITGGFPCQPFSVAGSRGGTSDPRGTLFWEILRLVDELSPRYLVLENVPGLLSIEDGETLRSMLNLLNERGYLIDLDILDAQNFGVPQRRRRVFIQCERSDLGLTGKTTTSANTIWTMILESLAMLLDEHNALARGVGSDSGSVEIGCAGGLRKRMSLLSPTLNDYDLSKLLNCSIVTLARSATEQESSGHPSESLPRKLTDMDGLLGDTSTESGTWNIGQSLKIVSNALCEVMKSSTTSTLTRVITESTISTFATVALGICESIAHLSEPPPNYWKLVTSVSTLLRGLTKYARSTGNSLFGDMGWSYDWDAFVKEAADSLIALGCLGDDGRTPSEILALSEGVSGDSSTGAEKGQDVAADAGVGFTGSSHGDYRPGVGTLRAWGGDLAGGSETILALPLNAHAPQNNVDETLIARTLTARHDSSPDGDRGFNIVTVGALQARDAKGIGTTIDDKLIPVLLTMREGKDGGGKGPLVSEDVSLTLATGNGQVLIQPFVKIVRSGARDEEGNLPAEQWAERETAPTLNAMDNSGDARATVLFALRGREGGAMPEPTDIANSLRSADGGSSRDYVAFSHTQGMDAQPSEDAFPTLQIEGSGHAVMETLRSHPRPGSNSLGATTAVRRLTPIECERLQGFPDGWTAEGINGPQADSARYKQMGNAVCVPVVEWIIKRLVKVDQ